MKHSLIFPILISICSFFIFSCSEAKAPASVEEVKAAMPEELKDSTIMKNEEEDALKKLSGAIDTVAKAK